MKSRTLFILINALLFQVGWFLCILLGSVWAIVFTGLVLSIHFYISGCRREDVLALLIALVVGLVHDSALIAAGIIQFAPGGVLPPLWLVCLWALLGITLNHSLQWIYKRFWLSSALGIIAGPLSYTAGAALSTAEWGVPLSDAVLVLAIMWLLVLPVHRLIYLGLSHVFFPKKM